jgi:hypothetical protein
MESKRLGSEVAKLLSRLCRAHKLPEPWGPADVVSLLDSYRQLVSANDQPTKPDEIDLDQLMQTGIPGAYEAMEAQNRRRVVGPKRKTKKEVR